MQLRAWPGGLSFSPRSAPKGEWKRKDTWCAPTMCLIPWASGVPSPLGAPVCAVPATPSCISQVWMWGYNYCSHLKMRKMLREVVVPWPMPHSCVGSRDHGAPFPSHLVCLESFWCCTHSAGWDQGEGWAGVGQRHHQPWVHWGCQFASARPR